MARDEDYGGSSVGSNIGGAAAKVAKTVIKTKKASTPKATARRTMGSRSSGSSGRSNIAGRDSYVGGGGNKPTSNRGGSAPKPSSGGGVVPGINSYLGTDSIYQNVIRGSKQTLADYLSELARRRGESTTQFNDTKAGMERDRTQQLEDLKNEYASRGLINSGLYAEEQGDFQENYMTQLDALQKQQTALIADLLTQQTNFTREQQLATERAKQEALQRRSAKYNIGG